MGEESPPLPLPRPPLAQAGDKGQWEQPWQLLCSQKIEGVLACCGRLNDADTTPDPIVVLNAFSEYSVPFTCQSSIHVTCTGRSIPFSGHLAVITPPVQVLVQPSNRRAYSMREYEKEGAVITDDISMADTILGENNYVLQQGRSVVSPSRQYIKDMDDKGGGFSSSCVVSVTSSE